MRRIIPMLLSCIILLGCSNTSTIMDRALKVRTEILDAMGCEFEAEITADYQEEQCSFKMRCSSDPNGNVMFEVIFPESISGITGQLCADSGKLTFDDHALLFSLLADGRLSPVSGPLILMNALRSGYVSGCGTVNQGYILNIDDSFMKNPIEVHVRTNGDFTPVSTEVYYKENRILLIIVKNFKIL